MPIPTWIRDFLGIRKDFVETKKALLEIARLQDEERERELITKASMADIEKYDANTRFLLMAIAGSYVGRQSERRTIEPYGATDTEHAALEIIGRLRQTFTAAELESDDRLFY
jgi:hypothetical protein